MAMMKTPMALITGGLGSGKTTLLRQILKEARQRLAVVMNEFGEMAIDGQVIKGRDVDLVELSGGCVCCSLTGEFEAAIQEILKRVKPDMIVVEATGVAEADALVFEVEDSLPQVRLDCVICLVDAFTSVHYPEIGRVARTQLENADIVLLNKKDLVSDTELSQVKEKVKKYTKALILPTDHCQIHIESLFGLKTEKPRPSLPESPHPHLASFTFETDKVMKRPAFEQVVKALPPTIYRAKGFVRFEEGSLLFNFVAGRWDFEEFKAELTQLVFIGPGVDQLKEEILERLRSCSC